MNKQFDGGWQKRPEKYTAEYLLKLYDGGVPVAELVRLCGVTRAAIYQQITKARKARDLAVAK